MAVQTKESKPIIKENQMESMLERQLTGVIEIDETQWHDCIESLLSLLHTILLIDFARSTSTCSSLPVHVRHRCYYLSEMLNNVSYNMPIEQIEDLETLSPTDALERTFAIIRAINGIHQQSQE
jgi:hypothetical protein